VFPERGDDLLLFEPALAHEPSFPLILPEDSHNCWTSFRGARQSQAYAPGRSLDL